MAGVKESSEPLIVRYLHMKAEKNRIPLGVTFELTSRCNFSCRMCYVHSTDCNINKPMELSAGQWIEIAQKAKEAGSLFVLITGGEPLVRDDFAEIYEAIAKMGFVISVNTNGSLIDDKILDLFTKYRPNRVNVSLYGADGETYKKLCGADAFEKVTGNIMKLRERSIPVKINSSITPYNIDDLDKMIDFCLEKSLVFKATGYMFPAVRCQKECGEKLTPSQIAAVRAYLDKRLLSDEDYADRVRRIKAGIRAEENPDCPVDDSDFGKIRCRAGRTSAWIDWRGNMSYCGMIPADENCNVLTKGFNACWDEVSKKASAVRMPSKCAACKYRHICFLCAASQFCEKGDFAEPPQYICDTAACMCGEYENLLNKTEEG